MEAPYIRIAASGLVIPLRQDVTTIGSGRGVDVRLLDPTVSRLHAEIVRRGPYVYVSDCGLSRNGTRVNGCLVARRVLRGGDVLSFGSARCQVGGIVDDGIPDAVQPAAPDLTRREADVAISLCRRALTGEPFALPSTAREIAADLVVTEATAKGHLLRLYQKFGIPKGAGRRLRLANELVALGLVRPVPQADAAQRAGSGRYGQQPGSVRQAKAPGPLPPASPNASPNAGPPRVTPRPPAPRSPEASLSRKAGRPA